MHSQVYQHKETNKKKKSHSLNAFDSGMLQRCPFIMQLKMVSKQPDLKTSLSQAENYGHHLDKIQCAGLATTAPIQMLPVLEEEENQKFITDINFNTNSFSNNNYSKNLINFNQNYQTNVNYGFTKNFDSENKNTAERNKAKAKEQDKEKEKKQHLDEHLTSTTNKISEYKIKEDFSHPYDPEVKRFLNKQAQENLTQPSSGIKKKIQQKNQKKGFVAPPSIYDNTKSNPTPKVGTRSQYLAKREAMDMLGNNKSFIATQRAVKKPSEKNTSKSEISKAEDSTHKVKLKNAAELVRDQVINEDRQAKEHLLGTLNLDPAIVAKQGGEQIILQKIH